MKFPWPTDAFRSGVASAITVFATICVVFIFLDERWHDLVEKQLEESNRQLLQAGDYERGFHEEQAKRRALETLVAELTIRVESTEESLTKLQNQKWREKYEADHLQLITVQEEYAISTKRFKGQIDELTAAINGANGPSADVDSIIAENIRLKDDFIFVGEKLRLAESELSQLRAFYANPQESPTTLAAIEDATPDQLRKSRTEALILSANGMNSESARYVIQNGVKRIGHITGDELVELVNQVGFSTQRRLLIVNIADYVNYPLTPEQMKSTLRGLLDRDKQIALLTIQNAEAKYLAKDKKNKK